MITATETEVVPYRAEDGLEMLRQVDVDFPDAEEWCRDAEGEGRAWSIVYKGIMVCCAGVLHKTDGIGLAWALYPPGIGKYHIDPNIAKDCIAEAAKRFNYRRIEATVREDFPIGHSYIRWLGFQVEGLLRCYEPDGTNAFMYSRIWKNGHSS